MNPKTFNVRITYLGGFCIQREYENFEDVIFRILYLQPNRIRQISINDKSVDYPRTTKRLKEFLNQIEH